MEQKVKVRSIRDDGTAQVMVIRESACSGDCHKCSGCGAAKETLLFDAVNAIGARPGEVVIVKSESAPVLQGAAVLYMVPLLLFFVGYCIGDALGFGVLGGILGFLAGIAVAAVYDRKVAGKRKTEYTITGYPAGNVTGNHIKGDNHID